MPPQPRSLFRWREIPGSVWALGLVSLFMDLSSEMIHALLPLYLVTVLGASALTVGLIEGIAEATASITKIFSGALSDCLGKRKLLAALGYGLAAFTKPVFPLASGIGWLTAARFIDRIGKGIRGAPRDALVADLTPADLRGSGLRPAPVARHGRRGARAACSRSCSWPCWRTISLPCSGSRWSRPSFRWRSSCSPCASRSVRRGLREVRSPLSPRRT